MIIEQTCNLVINKHLSKVDNLRITDVRVGLYLTAVRLSDDSSGVASTVPDDHPFCTKANRDFGDFTPMRIRGQKVTDILRTEKASGTILSLKSATINAVSANILSTGRYNIIEDTDPIHLLDLNPEKTITIVGAFHSYIRKISGTTDKLFVLELNEGALPEEYKKFFVPAEKYKAILPLSDIVIITGQTLVNRTIDDLLTAIPPGRQVVVTGPSGSMLPDILFENGVDIIGALRITDPSRLFEIVSEGGTGYHLFEYCAQKICIIKRNGLQAK